jgi:ubiquinone/menaquinone biosynthesis C-methylase UbiE
MKLDTNRHVSAQSEEAARRILIQHYRNSYGELVEQQVNLLLELDGYIDRFNYLLSVMGEEIKSFSKVLISGYSAGSEMIVARRFGFQEIYGVEVDSALFNATRIRLAGIPGMFPEVYDGAILPYQDGQFDLVLSGHIIEHTRSPKLYLSETMRVLKAGGFLYIEFPSRYHHTELHTGLFSFEWMPVFLRNLTLRLITSRISFLKPQVKSRYNSILLTGLQQVSRHDIFRLLHQMDIEFKELAHSKPAPGITRCLIQKTGNFIE